MARLIVCLSALLVLLVTLAALGESSPMRSCCTEYTEKPIPKKMLTRYKIQEVAGVCHIRAVIFLTVKNRRVCGDPDAKWVQESMGYIELQRQS